MPNDTSFQAIAAVRVGSNVATEARAPVPAEPPPRAGADPAPSPIINPTLRLDAGLGLVVIEFRNDSGAITTSIPSQRQLAAYQRWETTRLGPTPSGRSHVQAHAPAPAKPEAVVPEQHHAEAANIPSAPAKVEKTAKAAN